MLICEARQAGISQEQEKIYRQAFNRLRTVVSECAIARVNEDEMKKRQEEERLAKKSLDIM